MKSLSEIAKEMGVSVATVSYVYNNKWKENRISEAMAKKIQKKLSRENVRPNMLGEQLRTGKTRTIGVVLADLTKSYNLELLSGIERELAKAGYFTLLCNTDLGKREEEYLQVLIARGVDGILLNPCKNDILPAQVKRIEERKTPVVMLDNYISNLNMNYIVSDNKWGAEEAVANCVKNGCKRIGYLGGNSSLEVLKNRYAGYVSGLEKAGIALDENIIAGQTMNTDNIEKRLDELINVQKVDALFMESFLYFENGFKYLAEKGIRVPEDIMLTGFDPVGPALADVPQMRPFISSPIPHVRQKSYMMGQLAAEILLKTVNKETNDIRQEMIKPELKFSLDNNI